MNANEAFDFYKAFPDADELRPHAPYFSLSPQKRQNEMAVADILSQGLTGDGKESFRSITVSESDPPDCMAWDDHDRKIGIEVTELVNGKAIQIAKMERKKPLHAIQGNPNRDRLNTSNIQDDEKDFFPMSPSGVIQEISERIHRKDIKHEKIKGGPYDIYLLIIYCADPDYLTFDILNEIKRATWHPTSLIDRVYFLQDYCPWEKRCPYIELKISKTE